MIHSLNRNKRGTKLNKIKRKIKSCILKKDWRFLEIHIVEHCNLNCKGCAHFAPIAEKSCISLNKLESMYKNLKPIYNSFFKSIHLIGGEPLLHPEIGKVIELTRKYFPKKEIQIVTNGIKIPKMPEEFFEKCNKNNIVFNISRYPISINYKEICKKLRKYKIKVLISKKIKKFIYYPLDSKGEKNPLESYNKCKYGGKCIQLKDNKLFSCFLSAYISHINKYYGTCFTHQKEDYLMIDRPITKEVFQNFVSTPKPFCKFCKMKESNKFKWQLSTKKKEEWGIE